MKKLITAFLIILSVQANAGDSTRVKMGGTYTTTYGKVYPVYLDVLKSKLFYEANRHRTKKVYFRRVKL